MNTTIECTCNKHGGEICRILMMKPNREKTQRKRNITNESWPVTHCNMNWAGLPVWRLTY